MADNGEKLFGNYRGEVIDDLDPLEAGRVKIYVFGIYDDLPQDNIPWAIYSDPFMGGNANLGGMFIPDVGNHVWVFFEQGNPELPVYFAGAPARNDGPEEVTSNGEYPRNKVFKTKTGHMLEFDDSDGATRIRLLHGPSGTQKTYADNGDAEEVVEGNLTIVVEKDATIFVKGNVTETVEGNVERTVQGNVDERVEGNLTQFISGTLKRSALGRITELSDGGSEYSSTSNMNITGSRIDLNKGGGSSVEVVDGTFTYTLEYAFSYSAAADLVDEAGPNAPFDDQGTEAPVDGEYPEDETIDRDPDEHNPEDEEVQVIEDGCPVVEDESSPYNVPIGNGGLTVRDATLNPVFAHSIREFGGQSITDMVCNMHHLALNVVDPLLAAFPELRINSWFRRGSGASQHNTGMAVDCQSSSRPGDADFYREVLDFIASNLPYDQCIIESSQASRAGQSGVTYWIHISFDRYKSTQRKERLTYFGKRSPQYTSGWGL